MKRNMALNSIEEEGELQTKFIIPDTPMFRRLRHQEPRKADKQIVESCSQETLKQYTSEDEGSVQ